MIRKNLWKYLHLPKPMSSRNSLATISSHAVNQSIVQQLMSDGNSLMRLLNASPIRLIANTTCKLVLVRLIKKLNNAIVLDSSWRFFIQQQRQNKCIFSSISPRSSDANKLGISAVFRIMLMSSTNDSSLICVSLNRNTVGLPSPPGVIKTFEILK